MLYFDWLEFSWWFLMLIWRAWHLKRCHSEHSSNRPVQYTPQWTWSMRHRYTYRVDILGNVLDLGLDQWFPSALSTSLLSFWVWLRLLQVSSWNPFWNRFNFTIFELKSQNRNFNSLLREIFTNLAVKFEKSGIQSYFMRLTNRLVLDVNRQSRLPIFEGHLRNQTFLQHLS